MPGGGQWGRQSRTAKATKTPSPVDISWAAGFLEGEGYFGRHGGGRTCSGQRIFAAQKDEECLHKLVSLFGGTINKQSQVVSNLKSRDYDLSLPYWSVTGGQARNVMMTLYLSMSKRRQQAICKAMRPFLEEFQSSAKKET